MALRNSVLRTHPDPPVQRHDTCQGQNDPPRCEPEPQEQAGTTPNHTDYRVTRQPTATRNADPPTRRSRPCQTARRARYSPDDRTGTTPPRATRIIPPTARTQRPSPSPPLSSPPPRPDQPAKVRRLWRVPSAHANHPADLPSSSGPRRARPLHTPHTARIIPRHRVSHVGKMPNGLRTRGSTSPIAGRIIRQANASARTRITRCGPCHHRRHQRDFRTIADQPVSRTVHPAAETRANHSRANFGTASPHATTHRLGEALRAAHARQRGTRPPARSRATDRPDSARSRLRNVGDRHAQPAPRRTARASPTRSTAPATSSSGRAGAGASRTPAGSAATRAPSCEP